MNALSGNFRAILSHCARKMAQGQDDRSLDLFEYLNEMGNVDDIIQFLGEEVEKESRGNLTVRRVNKSHGALGLGILVATLPSKNAPTIIVNISPDMVCYFIGPYEGGFKISQPGS